MLLFPPHPRPLVVSAQHVPFSLSPSPLLAVPLLSQQMVTSYLRWCMPRLGEGFDSQSRLATSLGGCCTACPSGDGSCCVRRPLLLPRCGDLTPLWLSFCCCCNWYQLKTHFKVFKGPLYALQENHIQISFHVYTVIHAQGSCGPSPIMISLEKTTWKYLNL